MSVSPRLVEQVRASLAAEGAEITPDRVAVALRRFTTVPGHRTVLEVVDTLRRESVGAGVLEPLLREPGVTDVLVNGSDHVYVDRGAGLEPADVGFADEEEVRRLAQRLAASAGRRLDDASPFVDVRLTGGARFHAILAPVARPGTLLSLRVPSTRAFSLGDLTEAGSLSTAGERVLREIVTSRAAFLVSGGTGSGKTTLLAALLGEVDPAERLVIVEDASELRPSHPHVVGLEGRPDNVEGTGAIVLRALVRQALRMRPDRLVVGEVRGAEVVDMFAAMNTGHEGGCGTIHANSAQDVPARVEALGSSAGLPREAVHSQFASAVDVLLHLRRDRTGRRVLAEIATLSTDRFGIVRSQEAMTFGEDGAATLGEGAAALERVLERRTR